MTLQKAKAVNQLDDHSASKLNSVRQVSLNGNLLTDASLKKPTNKTCGDLCDGALQIQIY